jgi:hypothetical protein
MPSITDMTRMLQKAKLCEIERNDHGIASLVPGGKQVEVQFNPATLRISYSNYVKTDDQSSSASTQHPGTGNPKLDMELVFDVSSPGQGLEVGSQDVRALTKEVAYFISPRFDRSGKKLDPPPEVRVHWGTFIFDGVVVSMNETLELWSEDGRPLRATVSLGLTQKAMEGTVLGGNDSTLLGKAGVGLVGTTPLQPFLSGKPLKSLPAGLGKEASLKDVAAAHGIENIRPLLSGKNIDL